MPFAWLVHESDSLWSSSHAMHGRSCSCAHLSTASFFCPFRLPVSPLPLSLEQKVRAVCLWRKLSRLLLRSGVVPPSVCVVFIRPPVCERSRFSASSPFVCFFCRAVAPLFNVPSSCHPFANVLRHSQSGSSLPISVGFVIACRPYPTARASTLFRSASFPLVRTGCAARLGVDGGSSLYSRRLCISRRFLAHAVSLAPLALA